MKNKKWLRTVAFTLSVMMAGTSMPGIPKMVYAVEDAETQDTDTKAMETVVNMKIQTADDLKKFMEHCTEDNYSRGKVFRLENDLDMQGETLTPIAIFCGTFDGNGHTIRGFSVKEAGSDMGWIRFLEQGGTIKNLTLNGSIQPDGTGTNVGGFVGTNRGTIESCTFAGEVIAKETAGGIVGNNEESGIITDCTNEGRLLGTKKTGGIVGNNEGLIATCFNRGGINATAETVKEADEEEKNGTTLDFSLDLSKMATDDERITSTGGIAGINAGMIKDSVNYGAVGYPHVGYRTGGVVGYEQGCVDHCRNEGRIQGRKDTGGIVGLFEPYVEVNYEESTANRLRNQMDDLIDMLDELSEISKEADKDSIDNMDSVDESIDVIKDSIDNYKEHFQNKNDAFIDDMEEALDIVEKRIDMLDFDVDGEELANAILGMREDMQQMLKILEALKGMSGTTTMLTVMPSTLTTPAIEGETTLPGNTATLPDEGADGTLSGEGGSGTSSGTDGGEDDTSSSEDSAGGGSTTGGSSDATTGGDSGSSDSATGGDSSGSSGSVTGGDSGSSSDSGSGSSTGGDSDSQSAGSSAGGNGAGSDSLEGENDSARVTGNERQMEESVFRAAPAPVPPIGSMLPADVKELMKELGISEQELVQKMIELGWDYTDPEKLAKTPEYIAKAIQELASERVVNLAQDMNHKGDKVRNAADNAVSEGKALVDNADKLGTEIRHVIHVAENHIKDIRDDLRDADDDISRQMDVLDGRIDVLKDRLRDANDDVIDQMDKITDQMRLINDTASDGLDNLEEKINDPDKEKELSDYYDDLSDSDQTEPAKGKVMNCLNAGEIISDINGGGIAGFLSVELFDGESEFTIEKIGNRSLDSKRNVVGTIYQCKNNNEVTAKNDYAGGIVGRADLGAVVACQNYGDVKTVDGDYAGGIAGKSEYVIRDSYALCNITGNSYAGGIVGEGKNIRNSYAMTSIFSEEGEKFGAIAGDADGELAGNYYVEDGIAAVNGLTYESQAAPISYEELIRLEDTPADFQKFTIRFVADDENIKTLTCAYGESLELGDIPETPRKDGILGTWDKTDFTNIRRNMIVRAVYGDWTTALATKEEVPNLLISGQFLPNATLQYSVMDLESVGGIPGYEKKVVYQYQIIDDSLDGQNTFGIHILANGLQGKVCAAYVQEGRLKLADGKMDGRYYVFSMPSDGTGTVVLLIQEINWILVGVVAAIAILAVLVLVFCKQKKKGNLPKLFQKKKNKSSQK